jgi:alcohol dehydrogenase class IV
MASASPSDEVVIKSPAIAPFEFMTASRVVFGCGTSKKVPSLVKDLVTLEGCADKPALIVTGKSDRFSAPLVESLKAEGIDAVVYHCPGGEPTTATAEAAIALASSNNCGSVIAIGGGTPVDTGKCVAAVLTNGGPSPDLYDFLEVVGRAQPLTTRCAALRRRCPTTAGPGAEVTKNSVLEAGDRKVSMRHQFMLPELVVVGKFILILVWAIQLTPCFIYRPRAHALDAPRRHRAHGPRRPHAVHRALRLQRH